MATNNVEIRLLKGVQVSNNASCVSCHERFKLNDDIIVEQRRFSVASNTTGLAFYYYHKTCHEDKPNVR